MKNSAMTMAAFLCQVKIFLIFVGTTIKFYTLLQ